MDIPSNTRISLIARLSDHEDVAAWEEFVGIYLPVLYRLARRKGLQHADAEELAQEVLVAVARAVDRWQPDPERGRFRDWLFRIARNAIINFLTRPKHQRLGSGSSGVVQLLNEQCDPAERSFDSYSTWNTVARYFRWAAARVRRTVTATTWQAFWQTSVEVPARDRGGTVARYERGKRVRCPQPRDGEAAGRGEWIRRSIRCCRSARGTGCER